MTNPTTRYGHIEPEHQGKILNVKEAGPGEVEHHGGSFSKYMDNKNKKLQEQFDQQSAVAAAYGAASGHATSELFKAVSIMVNGFTTPSQADLKQIMAQHGGNFELYYHRGRITHIICSNLTDAKVKIFQRERDPTPVVRPEWVVESLQAGVILPLEEYVLWRLRDVPGQRTLSAFRQQPGTASHATEKPSHISAALPPSPYVKFAAAAAASSQGAVPVVETERAEAPADPRASADYRLAQERAAAARAACDLLRGPPKSSRDDPHFMDSYYKSSRLSFIGRWKARIEALTATTAAHAPLPQTAHQPSALASALRGNQAAEVSVERSIIHLDMDCFFASVAALAEPAFKGKPLAVSHSSSAQGTGEVSSANYEARKFGIRPSMFIAEAKKRCPHLIVMPYQFDKYEEVSEQVYRILLKATACVQPVSCDEAYLDVTGLGDPEEIVSSIRQQIFDATGCTASAGIGSTMLTARLATKKGKPNGQYRIHPHEVDAYLLDLEVDELPGVGWNICQKLKEVGIASVRDARASTKDVLQREIGNKTGSQVWAYAHGIDDRQVEPPKSRKSVGAECNWGIRFQNDADALAFMDNLAGELSTRMKAAGVRGRSISLKLKRRKTNAPDPPKFMGHGDCDNISRSVTLSRFTDAASELGSQGKALLRALRVDPTQIRGIGLNVTKLDTDPASAAAKPGSAAPSKVSAPPPSVHDPRTGPWVRFWQDKPQHWGVLPAVKSATELADANIGQHPPQADITSGQASAASAAAAAGKAPVKQAAFNMYSPSKGTLQVLQKPPSRGPSPRKQKGGVMVPHRAAAALPPASQIDASVLDALPLQVRRELEIAYGLAPKRSPNKGVKRGRQAGRGSGPARAVPAKRQRVLDPPQALARQAGRLAAHSRMTDAALSLTQVDPSVLSELPQELQDELAALLPSTSRAGAHNKQAQQPGMTPQRVVVLVRQQ
ncbi:hypothetical protein WJX82_002289 [Trebouxia sp. C0006]